MNEERVNQFIIEHKKSMGWYKRNKQFIRVRYLAWKYNFQDWYRNEK